MKKGLLLSLATFFASVPAFAQGGMHAGSSLGDAAYFAIGAGIAIGIAALGGALGQGRIGAAAMDGIARNPQAQQNMFVSMIIGLVLIESLVIYSLVIAVLLVNKI